jgi:modulator of FtsH protease HflK
MPWNDQKGGGGGPWGSGPGGGNGDSPWGRPGNRPSGGGGGGGGDKRPDRPDLEDALRKMQERLRGGRGGGNGAGGGGAGRPGGFGTAGVVILLGVGAVGWLMTGLYQVNEQEAAVVLRLGEYHRTEGPGFHIRLPNPIETHQSVPVNVLNETQIGRGEEESLMLTGDENIVDMDFSVNWRVNNARDFLFNVNIGRNEELIRQVGESAMREIVGTSAFEPITTGDRSGVESRVRDLMQSTLTNYKAGVEVVSISLKAATAPAQVVEVQRDVSSAEQDRARRINEANSYRNEVVPKARGEAQRLIQEAQAYKESSVAVAKGEADRFRLVYDEYRKAPRVTRERMFLETMERVLGRTDRIILDSGTGAVPILPLDQLRRPNPQGAQ